MTRHAEPKGRKKTTLGGNKCVRQNTSYNYTRYMHQVRHCHQGCHSTGATETVKCVPSFELAALDTVGCPAITPRLISLLPLLNPAEAQRTVAAVDSSFWYPLICSPSGAIRNCNCRTAVHEKTPTGPRYLDLPSGQQRGLRKASG